MIATASIRRLQSSDIPALVGVLSRAYGTGLDSESQLASYFGMQTAAPFVAVLSGIPVGMVVGHKYGRIAYVAQMGVDPTVQRRGIGNQLMGALIAWTQASGCRTVELDSTPAGAPLYARYGFVEAGRTDVYNNTAGSLRCASVSAYLPTDRAAVFAADAHAFGADRGEVLARLIDAAPHAVLVFREGVAIAGYAVAQRKTGLLGPVIAATADVAAALIDTARVLLPSDHRISVPSAKPAVAEILRIREYARRRSLVHMVRGEPPAADRANLFARINLGQG